MIASAALEEAVSQQDSKASTLASAFADVCRRRGDAIALTLGGQHLSYRELDQRSLRVAHALKTHGLRPGSLVAIFMGRTFDMIVAMLGITRAGCAYLPLDPGYPAARVLETLDDAKPALLLTEDSLAHHLAGSAVMVRTLSNLQEANANAGRELLPDISPEDLAYVIYTSGSTGKPKGVLVTHHNLLRLLTSTEHWFHFNERDVWTMFHSFAFDFSVWEIWGSLLTGGRLVLVPFAISRSPADFLHLLSSEQVTVLNQTPSAFNLLVALVQAEAVPPLALRLVVFGGEALNFQALRPWFERYPHAPQLINMYGITETTVHVTCRPVTPEDAGREAESLLGEPIPDLDLHLLDESLEPVREGEAGEICIGGAGVARGYLNRPELTAEKFVADPFRPAQPSARMYRSGDLARTRPDGELVYLGRADRQVKIHGFRIELGEVESVLCTATGIAQTCVTLHRDASGQDTLAAYYTVREAGNERDAGEDSARSLALFAAAHLPAHMRPSFYTRLERLPLNVNGKIDRAALPAPQARTHLVPTSSASSRSETERRIRDLWATLLGLSSVEPDENFFDIGGTSLLVMALRAKLEADFKRSVPIAWMFEFPTVRALARKLEAEASLTTAASTPGRTQAQQNAQRQREALARIRARKSDL